VNILISSSKSSPSSPPAPLSAENGLVVAILTTEKCPGRRHPRHRLHPRRVRLRWSAPPAVQGYLCLASNEFHRPSSLSVERREP
jgi:hypothetical protein